MGNVTSSLVRVTVGQTGGGTGEGGEEEHQMHTAKKERLIPKMAGSPELWDLGPYHLPQYRVAAFVY